MLNPSHRSPAASDDQAVRRVQDALDRLEALQSLELQQARLKLEAWRRQSGNPSDASDPADGPDFVVRIRRAA